MSLKYEPASKPLHISDAITTQGPAQIGPFVFVVLIQNYSVQRHFINRHFVYARTYELA